MTITLPHFPAVSKLSQSSPFQHSPNWRVSATRDLLSCMFIGVLAILPLDALVFRYGIYYSDMITLLQSVAMRSLVMMIQGNARPIEYFIVLAANHSYLPLWFVASLVCVVGAT